MMTDYKRRYDLDWLRVIAIGLLLIYHIAIAFQPWGVFIGFIQNNEMLDWLWVPMSMLNVWRIPLLFFISGMGVYLALRRRNIKELLIERSKRILLPYLFGVVAIVPLHILLWQSYYHQEFNYMINPAHLWFLGNIFVYVIALTPLFYFLKKNEDGGFIRGLRRLFANPMTILLIAVPFVLEVILVAPESFELYAMNWHGFWLGFIAFTIGFLFMYCGRAFWQTIRAYRWLYFGLGMTLYLVRLFFFELQGPKFMMAIESVSWILTVFGFASRYLNTGSKALTYLSAAAYPVYILHMVFLYLGSYILFGLELSAITKFFVLIAFTGLGCFVTYELIRRISFLRLLFGLKNQKKRTFGKEMNYGKVEPMPIGLSSQEK